MISQFAKITLENAGQLQVVGTLEGHTAPILSIDIAPSGQLLASGSIDGTVRVWNLLTQEQVSVLADNSEKEKVSRVAFSPTNPDHLAASIGRKPSWATSDIMGYIGNMMKDMFSSFTEKQPVWRLWSLEKKAVIHTEEVLYAMSGTAGLTYSRDGHWLAVMDGVFDITTELRSRAAQLTQDRVQDMTFSEDSQLLALATSYEKHPENTTCHFVEIYQVGSWQKVAVIEETRRISDFSAVRFLPNSHELLVRTREDNLRGGGSHKLYHFKGDRFEKAPMFYPMSPASPAIQTPAWLPSPDMTGAWSCSTGTGKGRWRPCRLTNLPSRLKCREESGLEPAQRAKRTTP